MQGIILMIELVLMMLISGYAIIYMGAGKGRADRFIGWIWTKLKNLVSGILRWVGQQVAALVTQHPRVAGVIVILILLYFFFGGHHW